MTTLPSSTLAPLVTIPSQTEQTLVIDQAENSTVTLQSGSKLTCILLGFEGWEGLKRMTFELTGTGSELLFLAFVVGKKDSVFQLETIAKHLATQTKAHFYLKSVMFDNSFIDYKGNLNIEKNGQLADAYLAHHTLLLSDNARARSVPALEIEADDIKAGHAATIGKVDKDLLFYLQSRGIEKKEAEEMLISGFFEELLKMIVDTALQEKIRNTLASQFLSKIQS